MAVYRYTSPQSIGWTTHGGFLKQGVPLVIIHFGLGFFHETNHPTIKGIPHSWKPPYGNYLGYWFPMFFFRDCYNCHNNGMNESWGHVFLCAKLGKHQESTIGGPENMLTARSKSKGRFWLITVQDPCWLTMWVYSLHYYIQPGWWIGTFFIFHNIWDNPSHWLIFLKMVKTTNQQYIIINILGIITIDDGKSY